MRRYQYFITIAIAWIKITDDIDDVAIKCSAFHKGLRLITNSVANNLKKNHQNDKKKNEKWLHKAYKITKILWNPNKFA